MRRPVEAVEDDGGTGERLGEEVDVVRLGGDRRRRCGGELQAVEVAEPAVVVKRAAAAVGLILVRDYAGVVIVRMVTEVLGLATGALMPERAGHRGIRDLQRYDEEQEDGEQSAHRGRVHRRPLGRGRLGDRRDQSCTFRNRNAFPITDTDETLIAALAIIGLSSNPNTG